MRIKPDLSHKEKEETVKDYALKYNLEIMVETGIFEGKMIQATHSFFKEIHSVELVKDYYDSAYNNFKHIKNVHLYNGNSPDMLKSMDVLKTNNCLIWLDAHDGKQSPAIEELNVIFGMSNRDHFILIDDMRNFDIRKGYPNINELISLIKLRKPDWKVEIKHDIMRAGISNIS